MAESGSLADARVKEGRCDLDHRKLHSLSRMAHGFGAGGDHQHELDLSGGPLPVEESGRPLRRPRKVLEGGQRDDDIPQPTGEKGNRQLKIICCSCRYSFSRLSGDRTTS